MDSTLPQQLYATLAVMFGPVMTMVMSVLVLMLLLTYVITSADSAILIVNTINAAGEEHGNTARAHNLLGRCHRHGGRQFADHWRDRCDSTAMIIGALPFSLVAGLMAVAVVKAILFDTIRAETRRCHHDGPRTRPLDCSSVQSARRGRFAVPTIADRVRTPTALSGVCRCSGPAHRFGTAWRALIRYRPNRNSAPCTAVV